MENLQFFPLNFQKEIMIQSIKNVKEYFNIEVISFLSSNFIDERCESEENYFYASIDRINSLDATLEKKPEKLLINQFKNEISLFAKKD